MSALFSKLLSLINYLMSMSKMDPIITYFICILVMLFITFLTRLCAVTCRSISRRTALHQRQRQCLYRIRIDQVPNNQSHIVARDRQGNIFTISDETAANTGSNRYPDFFYLEPNGDDAARIRAQLEKDDKDLPSYEEVMRMTSLSAAATTTTAAAITTTTPDSGIAITPITGNVTNVNSSRNLEPPPTPPEITGPVPPYTEVDPNFATNAISEANAASTSQGASVTIPINHSASNTSV